MFSVKYMSEQLVFLQHGDVRGHQNKPVNNEPDVLS